MAKVLPSLLVLNSVGSSTGSYVDARCEMLRFARKDASMYGNLSDLLTYFV